MNNNKGFTLTELLVCVVIFGIVLSAAFGFMLSSAKSYTRINDRIEVQEQSRMALNLIQEYVIDCNGGICFTPAQYTKDGTQYDCGTLYILGTPTTLNGETTCSVDVFRLDTASSELQYGTTTAKQTSVDEDNHKIYYQFSTPSKYYKVSDKTLAFSVVPDYDGDNKTTSATITVGMKNRSATYSGVINLALRNEPAFAAVS